MANYICPNCEYTKSTKYYAERVRCPECNEYMEHTDDDIEIMDDWESQEADRLYNEERDNEMIERK